MKVLIVNRQRGGLIINKHFTGKNKTKTKMNEPNVKSSRSTSNNEPWAILIALASLIIVATGIAIIVICILWEKYDFLTVVFL